MLNDFWRIFWGKFNIAYQIQKKRVRKKAEEHIDRVQKESKGTYNPKHGQPKGYRDIFEGDERCRVKNGDKERSSQLERVS